MAPKRAERTKAVDVKDVQTLLHVPGGPDGRTPLWYQRRVIRTTGRLCGLSAGRAAFVVLVPGGTRQRIPSLRIPITTRSYYIA